MTRRERLERKLELRQEWAGKAKTASDNAFRSAHRIADAIPFGQPILVGHHSERHARRDQARIHSNMDKGCERADMAANHISKAAGIEHALDRSIFSDDDNAVEALELRIAEHEAKRERMKTVNKLYRKGDAAGLAALGFDLDVLREKLKTAYSWCQQPYPAYELQNLGGRITADRKRLEYVKLQQERARAAEASENGVTIQQCQGGYVRVTFAEKPDRDILNSLRTAGFHWGGGSWAGKSEQLPQEVKDLAETKDDHSEPTYENQLWHARKILDEQGREALNNPHAMTGRACGCGACFCCAAAQVLKETTLPLGCDVCGMETVDVKKREDGRKVCGLCA